MAFRTRRYCFPMRLMLFIRSSTSVPLWLKENVADGLKKRKKRKENGNQQSLQTSAVRMWTSVPWHPYNIYSEIGERKERFRLNIRKNSDGQCIFKENKSLELRRTHWEWDLNQAWKMHRRKPLDQWKMHILPPKMISPLSTWGFLNKF